MDLPSCPCTHRELAELQKVNAVTQTAVEQAAASAAKSKEEEVTIVMGQQRVSFNKEKEGLIMQVREK